MRFIRVKGLGCKGFKGLGLISVQGLGLTSAQGLGLGFGDNGQSNGKERENCMQHSMETGLYSGLQAI